MQKLVLLIDDDLQSAKVSLSVLKATFVDERFRVQLAETPREAIMAIEEEMKRSRSGPALVICAYSVKDEFGVPFLNKLSEILLDSPLIMISDKYSCKEPEKISRDLRLQGHLPRPWDGLFKMDMINQIISNA